MGFITDKNGEINLGKLGLIIIVAAIVGILILLFNPIVTIQAGTKGVVLIWGAAQEQPFEQGLHFIVPLVTEVRLMDLRTQTVETTADAASKDLQGVTATVAVNFHIDPSNVVQTFKSFGQNYQERVNIASMIEESIKASTARFTAEELITKREDLKSMVKDELNGRLEPYNIIVETVNIVNFAFSEQFNRAIEDKVTATQQALTAQRTLERIKFEAEQKIAQAQGEANATLTKAQAEAQAIRITAEALKENPQLVTLEWVKKWDGKTPSIIMGSGTTPLISIPTQ